MSSLKELAIKLNEQIAGSLARTISAMPADKQTWSPLDQGRTALDQLQECAMINQFVSQTLEERTPPAIDREAYAQQKATIDTVEKALTALQQSVSRLTATIGSFPDEKLGDAITLPFGGGIPTTLGELMLLSYWNMTYHVGQINYIQTLYGDRDMH